MTRSRNIDGAKCVCGLDTVVVEVKKPGPNRGRWFWRCPTRACNYFKWDSSASPFAEHPAQAYALAQPSRRPSRYSQPSYFGISDVNNQPPGVIKKTKIRFTLATPETITISIEQNATDTVTAVLDAIAVSEETHWMIPAKHNSYQHALRALPTAVPNLNIEIEPMSKSMSKTLEWLSLSDTAADIRETEIEERMLKLRYYSALWKTLKPFQKKAIREAIRRDGRIVLADDAGLGKTMQAMGIMATFDDDWPVLIICPAETHELWVQHLMDWLLIDREDIHIVRDKTDIIGQKRKRTQQRPPRKKSHLIHTSWALENGADRPNGSSDDDDDDTNHVDGGSNSRNSRNNHSIPNLREGVEVDNDTPGSLLSCHKIYITTVKLAAKFKKQIEDRKFRFIVFDESQVLTVRNSVNNRILTSLMQSTDRLLLLWNSPNLSRPIELFNHLNALRKTVFPDLPKFGKSFCNGKQQVLGWNYSGVSNQVELKFILDEFIWIRRTKEDVENDLPF